MLTRITIVLAFTMLLLTPLGKNASARGVAQPPYFKDQQFRHRHHHHHHHRNPVLSPWYGYYDVPPYASDYDMTYSTPETVVVAPTPPTVGCQHSEQTYKIPSENGGVREVTIFRC